MKAADKIELTLWDLITIAYRRRWELILPLFISAIVGLLLSLILPKAYQASTMILYQPQQLPKDIVRTVDSDVQESHLNTIAQLLLNRKSLERIVTDFNLYSGAEYPDLTIEAKTDRLWKNVTIELAQEGIFNNAYVVSFMGDEPQTVMAVTNALSSYFIEANSKERESSAIGTSAFLTEELEGARRRLGEMEASLKEYRQRYMGELPEQLNSNLSTLDRLQDQLNKKEDALRGIRLSLSGLDKQIEEERYVSTMNTLSGKDGSNILEVDTTDVGLLKEQLANLLTRYTDQHPDVRNLRSKIAQLESEMAAKGGAASRDRSGFVTSKTRYLQQLERQRDGLMSEKAAVEADIAALNREIAGYQVRVENTPRREQEYITLQRDYENLSVMYKSLLNRKLEAEMAVSMEQKQKGEQFQILESARLPRIPAKPNLMMMMIASIVIGLGVGSGLVVLREYMQDTYNGPEEIESELEIPVIAAIPKVLTKRDIFMRRAEVTLCSLVIIMTVIVFGAFAFLSLIGTEQAIETVRQYLST